LKSEHFGSLIIITVAALFACLAFPATGGAHAWWKITIAGVEMVYSLLNLLRSLQS